MDPKEMYYFIGKCLAIPDNRVLLNEVKEEIARPDFPWDKFVRMGSSQFVIPALYVRFKTSGILYELPEDLLQYLEYIFKLNSDRNTEIFEQINGITLLLSENDISPIFLKGCANLLDKLYPDQGERMIGDIDLLVSDDDFIKTVELLKGDGYESQLDINTNSFGKIKHYPALAKSGEPAIVEIHRMLVIGKHSRRFPAEQVIKDKISVGKLQQYYIPSGRHRVMHNFMHSQINNHYHYYRQVALRDFYDVYLLARKVPLHEICQEFSHYKKKIVSWVYLMDKTFHNPGYFPGNHTNRSMRFVKRVNRNLSGGRVIALLNGIRFVLLKFWIYSHTLLVSIFSKSARSETLGKLRDKNWRQEQKQSYKGFFKKS